MSLQTLLVIHVCGATIGLLSGYLAMMLRKGSGVHRAAGTIFFGSMLTMAACAATVAFARSHFMNAFTSTLTFYLVVTGFLAARREKPSIVNRIAVVVVLMVAAGLMTYGVIAVNRPTGRLDGYPAALYFVFGSIALLHGASDIRMLLRGGVTGPPRIARHLWRMSLALLFATLSLWPGQPRFFPVSWQATHLLYVPHILLFGSMMLALVRMQRKPPGWKHRAAIAS
jgi:uncharacterized membrane protein